MISEPQDTNWEALSHELLSDIRELAASASKSDPSRD